MKIIINPKIKILIMAGLACAISVAAQGNECGNSPNALKDTQEFADKIVSDLKTDLPKDLIVLSQKAVDQQPILDHKFHKLDRSKKGIKKFDSVGIITGKPFNGQMQSYGSAVLISPCHVITNRHVVKMLAEDSGANLNAGNRVYFSVGQAKSCDSGKDFEEQNLNAKVMIHGSDDSDGQDWAIVKLDRPVSSEIEPAELTLTDMISNEKVIRVGYPYQQVKDNFGFKSVRAQYIQSKSTSFHGVEIVTGNDELQGLSGGGIFTIGTSNTEQFKPKLNAIYIGTDRVLRLEKILKDIVGHDQSVILDMKRAIETGRCQ